MAFVTSFNFSYLSVNKSPFLYPFKLPLVGRREGGEGYTVFTLSIRPYVRPPVTFWFLLLILLNNLSGGSHYLASAGRRVRGGDVISNKHCLLTPLAFIN